MDDREQFIIAAGLVCDNKIIASNAIMVEMFKDVEITNYGNVELINMLEPGEYEIAGEKIIVKQCGMLPVHFVSRKTGHSMVSQFRENDFSYWYNADADMITPILFNTFEAEGFTPILISGNIDKSGNWNKALAAAEKFYNGNDISYARLIFEQKIPLLRDFFQRYIALELLRCDYVLN